MFLIARVECRPPAARPVAGPLQVGLDVVVPDRPGRRGGEGPVLVIDRVELDAAPAPQRRRPAHLPADHHFAARVEVVVLPRVEIGQVLRGGAQVAAQAGCFVAGGHTIDDPVPKYGLAVVGLAHPDRLMTIDRAAPGARSGVPH